MVLRMGLPGNFYPPQKEGVYQRGEGFNEPPQPSQIQNPPPAHQRPETIHNALRTKCGIKAKEFLAIILDDNGEEKVYSSSSLSPYLNNIATERFRKDFRRNVRAARQNEGGYRQPTYSQNGMYSEFEFDSGHESRRSSIASSVEHRRNHRQRKSKSDESGEEGSRISRKRRYPRSYRQNSNDEASVPTRKTQPLRIDDEEQIDKLYLIRFRDLQQSSCKIMGKAFVKLVEPKKQTHHPYTRGDEQAPPWWPNTTGENRVRHKEPDHLLKPERTRLLVHILKMVIEPNARQYPSIQKLGLNVKKLEDAAYEVMNPWFNDKDHPENGQKRGFLKEIFKVAKAQEQFKNGEIDGTTMIPIMYGDKPGADLSEDEDEEDIYNDDDESQQQIPTPQSIVSPPLLQGPHHHVQQQMHEVENHIGQRIRPGPIMRTLTQPPPSQETQFNEQQYFGQRIELNFQPPQSPSLSDPGRRNFLANEYHGPQSMQNWQQPMMTNTSAANTNHYTTSPQSSLPPLNAAYLPPPPTQQHMHPPQIPHPFQFNGMADGLPTNRNFDAPPPLSHPIRTGSLPTYMPQQSFDGYLQDNHGFVPHEQDLKEEQHHQHMSQNQ